MDVILQHDLPSLGYVGDRVKVRPGYARNYLIPRGIAVEASSANERLLKHRLGGIQAKRIRLKGEAEVLKGKLEALSLEFSLRVGAGGRTFGSVTAKDIEAELKRLEYVIDRRQVKLIEPLKKVGDHSVQVKLHSEVIALVPVKIVSEIPEKSASVGAGADEKQASAEESGKKTRGGKKRAKKSDSTSVETEGSADSEQGSVMASLNGVPASEAE